MHKEKLDLAHMPISKLIYAIALPSSIGIIFNTLYNLTDMYFAGFISTQALAALSLSFVVFFLLIGVGFGLSKAIMALCSNAIGRKKLFLAKIYAKQGLFFSTFVVGFFVIVVGFLLDDFLLNYLSHNATYTPLSKEYLSVMLLSAPFIYASFCLNAVLVSAGDSKSYKNALVFGFFLNIMLDPLFIFTLNFGFSGIAYSTLLIQVLSSIYLLFKAKQTHLIGFENPKLYLPSFFIFKELILQAFPASLSVLATAFGNIILLYFISQYGQNALAGYGIAFRIEQLALLPLFGVSSALLAIIATNHGAKNYERIKQTLKLCFLVGFIICLIEVLLGLIFGRMLISFFDTSKEVIYSGYEYLKVAIFVSFAYMCVFFINSFLQAVKRPNMIFYISLYRQIIVLLPLFFLVSNILKLPEYYLWYSLMFAVYSSAIFLFYYVKKIQKEIFPC